MCSRDDYPPYPFPDPPPLPSIWWLIYYGLVPNDGPGDRDTANDLTDEQVWELIG
jgi:hypothetical protein